MEIKVTIIIPVHNAERYIDNCINSVIAQDYPNWELILVDDGSSDHSVEICDNYSNLDKRVKVKHQKNGGVSSARNAGLEMASGEWITFVDADDSIKINYLSSFISKINEKVDYISFAFENMNCNSKPEICSLCSNNALNGLFESGSFKYMQPWSKFFKKSIIENLHLRFDTKLNIGEDKLFILQYLIATSECVFDNNNLYNYNDGIGLSTKHYSPIIEYDLAFKTHKAIDSLVGKFRPDDIIKTKVRENEKAELFRVLYAVGISSRFIENKKIIQNLLTLYGEVIDILNTRNLNNKERRIISLLIHKKIHRLLLILKLNSIYMLFRSRLKQLYFKTGIVQITQ